MTRQTNNYASSMLIIGGLFFIFGFVTWLNGTLIPFLKLACDLNTTQAFFVTSAFYLSYFFLALPSANILRRTGFKNGMALGLGVMAVGCLLFIPAAQMRAFPLFLTGLFVQGMGLSLLQTASNPYVSVIGPIESGAQRISIMGICNKVAGIISPLILSTILLRNASEIEQQVKAASDLAIKAGLLDQLTERLIVPYIIMAIVLAALALFIRRSRLPEIDLENQAAASAETAPAADGMLDEGLSEKGKTAGATPALAGRQSIWAYPHALLGALAIFFYVGAEVMSADGIGIYGRALNFSLDESKYFIAFTMTGMLIGYVLSIILIPKYISQQNFLKYSAVLGLLLTIMTYLTEGYTAVGCMASLGLANAVMWPAIFPLAINKLGRFTQIGSALLIMGIAGGAIIPQLYALLEGPIGPHLALQAVMLPCYCYILYYAVWGYRPR